MTICKTGNPCNDPACHRDGCAIRSWDTDPAVATMRQRERGGTLYSQNYVDGLIEQIEHDHLRIGQLAKERDELRWMVGALLMAVPS